MTKYDQSLNECRRYFEAYCKDIDCYAGRHQKMPDQYQLYETQLRWMGWQAAWETASQCELRSDAAIRLPIVKNHIEFLKKESDDIKEKAAIERAKITKSKECQS